MIDVLDFTYGYRNLWNGRQRRINNIEEALDYINENFGVNDIGISVCAYNKDDLPILLYVPYDFDFHYLEFPLWEAITLYNLFVDYDYTTMITYSGSKGYHVYLKVLPKIYSKEQVRYIQELFKNILHLMTIDTRLFSDVRRILRLPNTPHTNGSMCEILAYHDGKELDIDTIVDVDRERVIEDYLYEINNCGVYKNEFHSYPCIDKLIQDKEYWVKHSHKKSFQPAQEIRMSWVALQLDKGKTEVEILDDAEKFGWSDFDARKTLYQIQHISGRGYVPYSCKRLKKMGYCVVRDCKHKSSIEDLMKEVGIK